ncbi:dioxygenase [Microbacterium invictum]|uniref:Dioxygenase n=1 Tax=Microbacterium invictum TaxID=515415 RepID=A0AA40SMX3_9MICO|nr:MULTISPECIES: dioxygenase [Microbacterium]MBB4139166.1 hypothetical protein [Microbacterium invictum]
MATGAGKKDARAASERARLYRARQEFHEGTVKRRTRDNVIAGVGGGILILAIMGGQWAYFNVGPGTPEPAPTSTQTPAPTETATPEPTDSATPEPTDTAGPTPDPTDTTSPTPTPTP